MNARVPGSLFLLTLATAAPAAPGDVDPAFNVVVTGHGSNGSVVYSPLLHTDGRIVLGGWFAGVSGSTRLNAARISAAGVLDPVFNPATTDVDSPAVRCIAMLSDGKVILAGEFTAVSGIARGHLARLNANGSLDASWSPAVNDWIYSTAVQPDGKLLIGGGFSTAGGVGRNRLARLHPNGTVDLSFNPNLNSTARVQVVQPDGKIIIGGNFTSVGGQIRNRLARLHADGSLDTGFNPDVNGAVYTAALLPDGRLIVGGGFTLVGGVSRLNLVRLHEDGMVDTSFNTQANNTVRCLALQTDGKVLLGGDFTMVAGITRNRNARLTAAGTLDSAFSASANAVIYGLTLQQDGKVLAGGGFWTFGGLSRIAVARLDNDPATQSLTVISPGRVLWLRGGASPETHDVSFQLSTDGGVNWTPAGIGSRITGGWELTGISLPAAGQIRALARTSGGYGSASSSVLESLATFAFTPLQIWRFANFGTDQNAGPAADNADPDKDGLENLVEFAFGLNPNTPDAAALPQWVLDEDVYVLAFTRPAGVSGITYVGEYSTSLAPGSWTPAENVGPPPAYTFLAPATTQRLYLRVRVTVP